LQEFLNILASNETSPNARPFVCCYWRRQYEFLDEVDFFNLEKVSDVLVTNLLSVHVHFKRRRAGITCPIDYSMERDAKGFSLGHNDLVRRSICSGRSSNSTWVL